MCVNKGLSIWDIKRTNKEYLFNINLKSFRQIRPIVKKTHSEIRILERHGFPFFLYRNRYRKMYFIGIIIFAIILYTLSLFIWDISLDGNYSHTESEIVKYLEDNNVRHGLLKKDIDCEEIEKMIRNKYFDITWVSAEISGTRLIIHVRENFNDFVAEEEKAPYNLISSKDAEIVSIITRSGTPMVSVGNVVKAGDMLVSGTVNTTNEYDEILSTKYVNADADIYGRTVYQYEDKIDFKYIDKQYTGKEKSSYYCYFFNEMLRFKFGKVKFDKYDTIVNDTQVRLARNFYIPIYYGKSTYKEYTEAEKIYTKDEIKKIANEHYKRYLDNLVKNGIQIIKKNVKIEFNNESCIVSGPITVIEKLGTIQPIDLNAVPEQTTENTP